jgi:hypothetical protein
MTFVEAVGDKVCLASHAKGRYEQKGNTPLPDEEIPARLLFHKRNL